MADVQNNAKQPKVTRITASGDKPSVKKRAEASTVDPTKSSRNIFMRAVSGFFGYFKGAWFELRQVRWPNRRATWSMTGALLGFTAFFVVFILLIDLLFENLFKLILR